MHDAPEEEVTLKTQLAQGLRGFGFWLSLAAMTALDAFVVWDNAIGDSYAWQPFVAGFWLCVLTIISGVWLAAFRPPKSLPQSARNKRRFSQWGVVLFFVCLLLSAPMTNWPLRLTFAASQRALDSLADRVERGESVRTPVQAGFFTIQQADLWEFRGTGRYPCLWIENHATGGYGFVRGLPQSELWKSGRGDWEPMTVVGLAERWVQADED